MYEALGVGCIVPVEDRADLHQMLVANTVSNAVCREQVNVVVEYHRSCLRYIHWTLARLWAHN